MAKGVKTGGRDFAPGQSGNPSGHPKGYAEFRAACREYSHEALEVIVRTMRSDDEKLAFEAAKTIHERSWGRAPAAPEDNEALRDARPLAGKTAAEILAAMRGEG